MNKTDAINLLGKILSDNLGSRMTLELANGIVASFAHQVPDAGIEVPAAQVEQAEP